MPDPELPGWLAKLLAASIQTPARPPVLQRSAVARPDATRAVFGGRPSSYLGDAVQTVLQLKREADAATSRLGSRQAAGGAPEGALQLLGAAIRGAANDGPAIEGNAKTGTIRYTSAPTVGQALAPVLGRAAGAVDRAGARVGDAVAGGAPRTEDEHLNREVGRNVGNIAAFELAGPATRAAKSMARMAGNEAGTLRLSSDARTPFNEVPAERFASALQDFKAANPDGARFHTWRTPEEMQAEGMKTFLSPDGKTGYALAPDGDIRNVFNIGGKGAGAHAMADAVDRGGRKLDAFDAGLGDFYTDFGFRRVGKDAFDPQYAPEGWDYARHGKPDITYMELAPGDNLTAEERLSRAAEARAARKAPSPGRAVADSVAARAASAHAPPQLPESWGVFNPNAPKIQGTAQLDPRLVGRVGPRAGASELARGIAESPYVHEGLYESMMRGLKQGAGNWYETGGLKQYFDENPKAVGFQKWLNGSAVGSSQAPTNDEIVHASVLRYADKHEVPVAKAVAELQRRYPGSRGLLLTESQLPTMQRADANGLLLPASPASGLRKTPMYQFGQRGGAPMTDVALDGKERQMLLIHALKDPELRPMVEAEMAKQRDVARRMALKNGATPAMAEAKAARVRPLAPITNADDYHALSTPYMTLSEMLGLPSSQAGQAGSWVGSAAENNLLSSPRSYQQVLEDGLAYKAKVMGHPLTPTSLQSLWEPIAHGEDFFIPAPARTLGGFGALLRGHP